MASASFRDQGKIVAIKARDPEEEQHYDALLSDLTKGAARCTDQWRIGIRL